MAWQNFRLLLKLFPLGLCINVVLIASLPIQGQEPSDLANHGQTLPSHSVFQAKFDPPDEGEPDDTAGGASRDSGKCPQDAIALSPSITPLMPATSQGLTVADHPTFFVYVPQTSAQKAFFSLKDSNEDYYYQVTLPLPETPGIISFTLPDDAPALEIGKSYQWSFVTICGEKLAVDDPRVEGRIERVELNSARISQLENLSPLERTALYGADGIWFDTLTTLADLRRSHPEDSTLAARWEALLESVGLEAIATKPLVD